MDSCGDGYNCAVLEIAGTTGEEFGHIEPDKVQKGLRCCNGFEERLKMKRGSSFVPTVCVPFDVSALAEILSKM